MFCWQLYFMGEGANEIHGWHLFLRSIPGHNIIFYILNITISDIIYLLFFFGHRNGILSTIACRHYGTYPLCGRLWLCDESLGGAGPYGHVFVLLLCYLLPFLTHPARLRLIHLYYTVNTMLIITFIIHKNNGVDTYYLGTLKFQVKLLLGKNYNNTW